MALDETFDSNKFKYINTCDSGMKLVFIYGPPATGKLTIAKELAKLTGYKIFHNHLTVDLIKSIFPFGTPQFENLNSNIRIKLFEAAAKDRVNGIIFTFCYAHPDDDNFVKKVVKRVEKRGGHVYFVHIYCDKFMLLKRVKGSSRWDYDKIKTAKSLKEMLRKWDFFTSIPFYKSFRIDNTKLPPKKVASMIKNHHKL